MTRWKLSLEDRFWAKVDRTGTCWLWTATGYTRRGSSAKYGTFWVNEIGRKVAAHRVAWWLEYGAWPSEVLDHTCEVTLCVRPSHLRDVTHAVNIAVGTSPSAVAARTGVCQRGHSDWRIIAATGKRRCRVCEAERQRARRHLSKKNGSGNTPAVQPD